MSTLHDQLDDLVADVHADLPDLTAAARRRGLAQRRRRRALAAVGAVAAAAVVVCSAWALQPGRSDTQAPVATDTPSARPTPSSTPVSTVALDGPRTAGLLAHLVAPYGLAAISSAGQDGSGMTYAELELAGGAKVEVNVQPAAMSQDPDGLHLERADDGKVGTDRWDALYVDHARGVRITVAVVVPQGLTPPLSQQQLGALASDPAWAFDVPSPAPTAPAPYTDLG